MKDEVKVLLGNAPWKKEKNFKALLVNLPWQENGKWGVRAGSRWPHLKDECEGDYLPFPFFLAYTTTLLQKYDVDAALIDAIAEQIPENFFLERIDKIMPDLLVVETSTPSLKYDLDILKRIGNKHFSIALCGPEVNIRTPEFLKNNEFIDYILVGEYEFTLLDLVQHLSTDKDLKDVLGLVYHDKDEIRVNPPRPLCNLDSLPWPLRDRLPMGRYLDAPCGMVLPSVQMLASRGCPFRCNFCLWPQVMYFGNSYRTRDITDVINEMEFLVKERGFKSIYFDDDTFNIGKERMLKFCREIKKRGLENILPWAIMARPDLMDEEILTQMKSAGLWSIKYGIESFNAPLIKNCHKNLHLEKTTKMIKFTKDLGIKVHPTFCFGLAGETKETIQRTIDYALSLNPDSIQFSILTPFPGTQLFAELDKAGRILTRDWSKYDGYHSCVFKPENLSPRDLIEAKRRAYQIWGEYSRKGRDFRENVEKFSIYLQEKGPIYTFKKTISYLYYLFIKIKLFKVPEISLLFKSRVQLIYKEIRTIGITLTFKKIKDNYLDIIGIFSKNLAFKGPNFVQIDLTNKCNNNCIACWCNSPLLKEKRNDEQSLSYEKVIELINTLKKMGTKEIYLAGGGEPFMYPQILEVIRYIKKKGFICDINTNFTLVNEELIRKLVKLKIDYLMVSLWASSPDIYKITHPNKDKKAFYRIEQMLKFLAQIKDGFPRLYITNVIFNLNWQDIEHMIDFALKVKADGINFAVVDMIPGMTDKLLLDQTQRNEVIKTFKRIMDKEDIRKKIDLLGIDTFMRRLSNPFSNGGNYDKGLIDDVPCYTGWLFSRILANGDVNACLKAHRIPVGNIYMDKFQKIWNSRKMQEFRKQTCVIKKKESFFTYIGNNPDIKEVGCYRSCDDFARNVDMDRRIKSLAPLERKLCHYGEKILSLI